MRNPLRRSTTEKLIKALRKAGWNLQNGNFKTWDSIINVFGIEVAFVSVNFDKGVVFFSSKDNSFAVISYESNITFRTTNLQVLKLPLGVGPKVIADIIDAKRLNG